MDRMQIKNLNTRVNPDPRGNSNFQAGQVSEHIETWKSLGAPKSIISVLSGYRIPFMHSPPLRRFNTDNNNRLLIKSSPDMSTEMHKMLSCKAIAECSSKSGFLSPMFLRKKSDGSNRPIFNLKLLNKYLHPPRFRLINHHKIPLCINRSDYMVKIDLSQAYFHIPIIKSHRRFLAFNFDSTIYEMTCLPFGLATAPYIFAKITNWVANFFREKGIRVIVYLDDFLLIHPSPIILSQQNQLVQKHLLEMGWCINYQKTSPSPSRAVEYLGIHWDTEHNIKRLPQDKVLKCAVLIKDMLTNQYWTWWLTKVLLGNINFASFVIPLGRLHSRRIQIAANKLPMKQKHKRFPLPIDVSEELEWWLQNLTRSSPIHHREVTAYITTDAAGSGWGAMCGSEKLKGRWNRRQQNWHSNQKELWSVLEVIKRKGPQLQGQTVMIQSDNKSVVAYITKQGGTKSLRLLRVTHRILELANQHQINIVARYLPGRYNATADCLSRSKELTEWTLSQKALRMIFKKLGTPEVDLFASARSAICHSYVSEDSRDPKCLFVNAFSRQWNFRLGWLFPPPALIPRVLRHLPSCSGRYLLVAPKWERTFWKAELRQRTVGPPFTIPNLPKNLIDLRTGKPPPAIKEMCLQVWKVQAGPTI